MIKPMLKSRLLVPCAFLGLAALVLWGYHQLSASRQAVDAAVDDLRACRKLLMQIKGMKVRPTRAGLEARSETELASRIESAAESSQLPSQNLLLIDPQPARRVADSPEYMEQPSNLELQHTSMQQLVTFLYALTEGDSGLEVNSLRLQAPRRDVDQRVRQETWRAEVTLTSLIFAPESDAQRE